MENPSFQNDDDEPSPPTTPPPPVEEEHIEKKKKKKNSVVFMVSEDEVITDGPTANGDGTASSPQRKITPAIIQMQPGLNLSPLMDLVGNTLSFHLTTKFLACCPQMALTPVQFTTETFNAETNVVSSENNATSASPTMAGCQIRCRAAKRLNWCLCCCMGSVNSQVVTVAKGDSPDDVLSFVYSPHIWCPASNNERLVDIFLPGMNEPLGWIEAGRDIGSGSRISCGLTKEAFITRQVHEKGSPRSFKIENSVGLEVANGKVTTSAWMGSLGLTRWTGFQFNFVPSEVDTLPHPTRAVLLVAFMLWVIDAREKKQWQYIWSIIFVLFLLLCFFLIQFYGPKE